MTRLPTLLVSAALILAASLGSVLVGYLAINVPGAWFPSAAPQRFDAAQMGVSRGRAQAMPGALLVSTANAEEPAVVVLKATLARATSPASSGSSPASPTTRTFA
jgi:hypothetical protein